MPLTSKILSLIAPSLVPIDDSLETANTATFSSSRLPNEMPHPSSNKSDNDEYHNNTTTPSPSSYPSQSPSLPTLLLIHGGWQTPHTFSLLAPLLRSHGYTVHAPALPSCCSTTNAHPDTSFQQDVAVVREVLLEELGLGREVVVVMHSYGAVVGCEAVRGLGVCGGEGGGVKRLVFITGMVLPVGMSCWKAAGSPVRIKGWEIGEDFASFSDGASRFYHDYPPALAQTLASQLTPMSCQALRSPLTHPAYNYIPSSYLLCTLDRGNPKQSQLRMIKHARITDVQAIEAGHVPFANPALVGEVARFVVERAGGGSGGRGRRRVVKL